MSNVDYKIEKTQYKMGTPIIMQGVSTKEIYFLNEGTVEIKRCGENIKGLPQADILKKSKRIGDVQGPCIFAIENLLSSSEQKSSYIARSDCRVTIYRIPSHDYIGFFKNIPQIGLNVLLTMKDQTAVNIQSMKKIAHFMGEVDKIYDNFQLFTAYIEDEQDNELLQSFQNNGGVLPPVIEGSFLTSDYSTLFSKQYGNPGYDPNSKFEGKKIQFYHFLLKSRPDAFIKLIGSQMGIFKYIYDDLSDILIKETIEIEKLISKIEHKLDDFYYNDQSPFNIIVNKAEEIKNNEKIANNISQSIVKICRTMDHFYKQLTGNDHTDVFEKFDHLRKVTVPGKVVKEDKKRNEKYHKMVVNSKDIILKYAKVTGEEADKIKKNLAAMNKIDFKDPTAKESRQIIRRMQEDFYVLYHKIFFESLQKTEALPLPVKLFIYYGFFDETLLTDDQIEFIIKSLPLFEKVDESVEYPIVTLYDYLLMIYNGEEIPGLSAGGEEFSKILRKNYRTELEDTPEGRSSFEFHNMAKECLRITSNNPRAYVPYLIDHSLKGNLSNIINTPKRVSSFIKKINDADPTLFFRELTWKIPGKSELIKKEIKPYFILLPNAGIRVQLWQEIVNNSRSSRGRFLLPVFFNDGLEKPLINAFAHFRWNLTKLVVGASWMDPVDGGFVGAFYDFSQYYNKMSELSLEAKDKIKQLFYKIKGDDNRFAYYYEKWILYEKEGIAKVNKVVRKIFYKNIPFPREIRERLQNLPLYESVNTRYNNVLKRDLRSLEARYHKYEENGELPEDLQAYLDILRR